MQKLIKITQNNSTPIAKWVNPRLPPYIIRKTLHRSAITMQSHLNSASIARQDSPNCSSIRPILLTNLAYPAPLFSIHQRATPHITADNRAAISLSILCG
ncbi:MAG: hypothetical protein SO013_06845 [Prevotella sp.]|nr:hypothetical protein [Prevotella sp.]